MSVIVHTSTPVISTLVSGDIPDIDVVYQTEDSVLWMVNTNGIENQLIDNVSQFAWNPNGEWLAAIRKGDLWLLSLDEENQNRIVMADDKGDVYSPTWNSYGTKIALIQTKGYGEVNSLSVFDIENLQLNHLFEMETNERVNHLSWSPDDQSIALVKDGIDLTVINIITKQKNKLVGCAAGLISDISWFPQSNGLVVVSMSNGRYALAMSCTITLEGKSKPLLENSQDYMSVWVYNPVWIDNETLYTVAYTRNPDEPELERNPRILQFDKNGQFSKVVSPILENGESLTLSPDGEWAIDLWSDSYVSLVNLIETKVSTYTIEFPDRNLQDSYFSYRFASDNQHLILMVGKRSPHYGALYILNFQTGELVQLTQDKPIVSYEVSPILN